MTKQVQQVTQKERQVRFPAFEKFRITNENGNITKKTLQGFETWLEEMSDPDLTLIVQLTTGEERADLFDCWKDKNPYHEENAKFALQKYDSELNTSFPSEFLQETFRNAKGGFVPTRHLERLMDLFDIARKYPQNTFLFQTGYWLKTEYWKEKRVASWFFHMPGVRIATQAYIERELAKNPDTDFAPTPNGKQPTFEALAPNLYFFAFVQDAFSLNTVLQGLKNDYWQNPRTKEWRVKPRALNVKIALSFEYDKKWHISKNAPLWMNMRDVWVILNTHKYPKTGLADIRKFCRLLNDKNAGVYLDLLPLAWMNQQITNLEARKKKQDDKDLAKDIDKLIDNIRNSEDSSFPERLKPYRQYPNENMEARVKLEKEPTHRDEWELKELSWRFKNTTQTNK